MRPSFDRLRYDARMPHTDGVELGHGVRVLEAVDGGLVVHSPQLDLGWSVPSGRLPGTAVRWRESHHEVAQRVPAGQGHRWILMPWPGNEAMRTVVPLDREYMAAVWSEAEARKAAARRRRRLLPLLPVLGFAPATTQERWFREWGYPSVAGTTTSALAEIAVGTFGVMQILVLAAGGEPFLPRPLVPLVFVGPLLWFEGLARLYFSTSGGEARGSLLGLPLLLLEPRPAPPRAGPTSAPEVRQLAGDGSLLELWSPVRRPDWEEGGLLPYRDRLYRGCGIEKSGSGWLYAFVMAADEAPAEVARLRLLPPPPSPMDGPKRPIGAGGMVRLSLLTVPFCFAPRRQQELWAPLVFVKPTVLTLSGAGTELIGGVVNLVEDLGQGSMFVLLDLFLVGERLVRLAVALVQRRALGSLRGWPLRPLYRRWVQEKGPRGTSADGAG